MTTSKKQTIQTCGLDHLVLHVSDLERSKKFYTDVLGMRVYQEWEGHAFMRSGETQIGIFEARGEKKPQAYTEFDHVAIRVESGTEEEIKEAVKEWGFDLLDRGEGLGWDPTPNVGIYIHDPDGHRIQLLPPGHWPA